jgi:hypothetical protein
LESEFKLRARKCCVSGKAHTQQMIDLDKELNNPPHEIITLTTPEILGLVSDSDRRRAQNYMQNARAYNSAVAFGSVICHTDNLGKYVCRLNGENSYFASDLEAPEGKSPLFAQLYVIDNEVAMQQRMANDFYKDCREDVLRLLVKAIDTNNPLAKAYKKAYEFYEDQKKNYGVSFDD